MCVLYFYHIVMCFVIYDVAYMLKDQEFLF